MKKEKKEKGKRKNEKMKERKEANKSWRIIQKVHRPKKKIIWKKNN
jgi:hypothetical protein